MQENLRGEQYVGNSQFHMIRCVVAMAHADGIVCDKEIEHIENLIARMPFNAEQKSTLRHDLKERQNVSSLLAHINDPKYRGQVVYFARLLAYKDGELHPSEEALLKRMHLTVTDGLDMEQIRSDVHNYVTLEMVKHETNMDAQRPDTGLFGLLDRFMLWCGIDLMDE
ncbi:MAG: DUF533 domain-containing protein [Alphaproteobacteria bacterium]